VGLPFDTVGAIINDAAVEVGLASVADPFASTDPNFVQLSQLLKSLGRNLRRKHQWTFLQQIYTFNTVANIAQYGFPVDFGSFIDQTGWNRTNRLPLGGPLSPQDYEYLKALLVGIVFNTPFRFQQQNFVVYPDTKTPANYVIAFEYISRWWITPTGTQATSGPWTPTTTFANATYVSNGGRIYKSKTQPAWQALTAYSVGNAVTNGGNVYVCTTAGTSAGAGGPSGTGVGIVDGTCVWAFSVAAGSGVSGNYGPIGLGQSFSKPAWAQSTGYSVGNAVTANSNIYICTVAGTSSASGTGPSGTGLNITDGTCTWNFSTTSALSTTSAFADGSCLWDFIAVGGADKPGASADIVNFDSNLCSRALKLAFLAAKGFDTTAAQADFDMALEQAIADDTAAPILNLNRQMWNMPLISDQNLPITGFGS